MTIITNLENTTHIAIITENDVDNNIYTSIKDFETNCTQETTGKVLIDSMWLLGNSSDRFMEADCVNGEVDIKVMKCVTLDRKHELRIKACEVLQEQLKTIQLEHQNYIFYRSGAMNSVQVKMILKGLTI